MPIRKLAHFSIRTARLDESRQFYTEVLGLKEGYRPALEFPGAWLYHPEDATDFGVVHLIGTAGDTSALTAYLGDRAERVDGTGALDHLAFLADDMEEFQVRLKRHKIAYRTRTLPSLGLRQLFFSDPSGLTIEMNFPASVSLEVINDASACSAG